MTRIKKLVIPPAWKNVRISYPSNGHLQAVGKDAKSRKQYRYHPMWSKVRNQTKFYRMATFGKILPKIREQVDADLDQKGWTKSKVIALVVKLMDETHIRIGSEQYAKRNQTYGLTTLRKRHLDVFKDKIKFQFRGKRGKEHEITIRNKKLVKVVSKCEEIPGWELFKYFDRKGDKHSVDSEMINTYLHKYSGHTFTAKDFRTWAATVVFFDTLMDLGVESEEKAIKKNLLLGFDAAAKALGNTRNVCRKYYVHPFVVSAYEDGTISQAFEKSENLESRTNFSASEISLLELIENYRPAIEFQ